MMQMLKPPFPLNIFKTPGILFRSNKKKSIYITCLFIPAAGDCVGSDAGFVNSGQQYGSMVSNVL